MFKIVSRTSETNWSSFNNLPVYNVQIKSVNTTICLHITAEKKTAIQVQTGISKPYKERRENDLSIIKQHRENTLKWRFHMF